MKDTCDLIELYSTGKISLDSFFIELESGCSLNKKQIIEDCNWRISVISSSLENLQIRYLITEMFILATLYELVNIFIQNKFAIEVNLFSAGWIFMLIYLIFVNTVTPWLFDFFVVNLFFKTKFSSLEKLKNLKTLLRYHDNNIFDTSCLGCLYYHGKSYQDNFLVCGIHPYGLKDCPDFEAK